MGMLYSAEAVREAAGLTEEQWDAWTLLRYGVLPSRVLVGWSPDHAVLFFVTRMLVEGPKLPATAALRAAGELAGKSSAEAGPIWQWGPLHLFVDVDQVRDEVTERLAEEEPLEDPPAMLLLPLQPSMS